MTVSVSIVEELLNGNHRALARVISKIENREPGYRDIVSELYPHTGHADIIGITGSPGAGKSTLVDKLAKHYRDNDLRVGVIGIDPASPFTGGSVLGDRIRMGSTAGDMDVFFRSMSARGSLGGLSAATTDAVKALDAFGKDKIIIETVGAGQNEIDIVKTADTVAVLVPPQTGDDVQMLKAGILEIADIFTVNKADLPGVDRTVRELREMIEERDHTLGITGDQNHHSDEGSRYWEPRIVETISKTGEGIEELMEMFEKHAEFLDSSGLRAQKAKTRIQEELRTLLREDTNRLIEAELAEQGGIDQLVDKIMSGSTDPYATADSIIAEFTEPSHTSPRTSHDT
jgi:LAO/AO transport system kinase